MKHIADVLADCRILNCTSAVTAVSGKTEDFRASHLWALAHSTPCFSSSAASCMAGSLSRSFQGAETGPREGITPDAGGRRRFGDGESIQFKCRPAELGIRHFASIRSRLDHLVRLRGRRCANHGSDVLSAIIRLCNESSGR